MGEDPEEILQLGMYTTSQFLSTKSNYQYTRLHNSIPSIPT